MNKLGRLQNEVKKMMHNEPAHDFEHILRVCNNAKKIARHEQVDEKMVVTAALLHDVIHYPKTDTRSSKASVQSAKLAKKILKKYGYQEDEIRVIVDAIRDHSFSRGKTPKTMVGKILQDADRLDALGAIGIARTFSVSGAENRPFYNKNDPFCKKRSPDDTSWSLDHFFRKLLLLEGMMNTKFARKEAKKRTIVLKRFLSELKSEIQP